MNQSTLDNCSRWRHIHTPTRRAYRVADDIYFDGEHRDLAKYDLRNILLQEGRIHTLRQQCIDCDSSSVVNSVLKNAEVKDYFSAGKRRRSGQHMIKVARGRARNVNSNLNTFRDRKELVLEVD